MTTTAEACDPRHWAPERRAGWLGTDWAHARLRDEMLSNPRLRRKVGALAGGAPLPDADAAPPAPLGALLDVWGPATLAWIGLCWSAPRLPALMADRRHRAALADIPRVQMRDAMRYSDRAEPALPDDPPDWPGEGAACLWAWADRLDAPWAAVLRLRLPVLDGADPPDRVAARADLVDRLHADGRIGAAA